MIRLHTLKEAINYWEKLQEMENALNKHFLIIQKNIY